MRGVFVTGTDTGVGKSVLAAAICAALAERGLRVAAFKPAVTGTDEPPQEGWQHDHALLAGAAGGRVRPEEVAPYRFGPAVSPHYASELTGRPIEPAELLAAVRRAGGDAEVVVCEGVGGLLVPLTGGYSVRDLCVDLGLPLVVAARTGLGTINHSLLTLEAARAAGLAVRAVVMSPWPEHPAPIERSNRASVEALGGVPVFGLPQADPRSLARAAAKLPLDDWLAEARIDGGPAVF